MKRMRIMGLGIVAIFAMTALFAASASAGAPEYGRCLAHATGKWKTSGCTTPSKAGEEKFEWYPAEGAAANGESKPIVKKGFKSKANESLPIQLEGTGEALAGVKTKIVCKTQSSEGEITGNKTAIATKIVFGGCESSGAKCKGGATAVEGEIQVNDLSGVLGVEKFGYNKEKKIVEPAKTKLANEFTPTAGEEFTHFECASLKVTVRGHVLNPLTANKMLKSATVKFVASGGNQKPEHFSESINLETGKETFGPELVLEAKFEQFKVVPFEESGQTLTTVQTNEEAVEANAAI
jgi:hypothetical protein